MIGSNRNTYLDDYIHFNDFKFKISNMKRLDSGTPGLESDGNNLGRSRRIWSRRSRTNRNVQTFENGIDISASLVNHLVNVDPVHQLIILNLDGLKHSKRRVFMDFLNIEARAKIQSRS